MSEYKSYYEGAPEGVLKSNDFRLRTKFLIRDQPMSLPEFKAGQDGESKPKATSDRNREKFLDMLFDNGSGVVSHPFFDTFRGFPVDHMDVKIDENNSHASEFAEALKMVRMTDQNYDSLDKSFERWARKHRKNSVVERMRTAVPAWDEKQRLDTWLINFFNLRDTEENRQITKYFWLSLYNRLVNPGCQAPIIIALIGDQDVGKSYFSVRLCQTILNSKAATSTSLSLKDIERNQNDWLRKITGKSVVANIGEMKGFKKTDIETIKEFTTRTVDDLHHKYQSGVDVERQWIVIMDGNSYEGFQRDETGNRRFYPLFVNQGEDKDGQPWWPRKISEDPGSDWKANFKNFDKDFWQIMAECKDWFMEYGQDGYNSFVGKCSTIVSNYSSQEMKRGRGIIRDDLVEATLQDVMMMSTYQTVKGNKNQGMFITNSELNKQWQKVSRAPVNLAAIRRLLTSYGYENLLISPFGRGFLLRNKLDAFEAKKYFYNRGWEPEFDGCERATDEEVQAIIQESMSKVEKF